MLSRFVAALITIVIATATVLSCSFDVVTIEDPVGYNQGVKEEIPRGFEHRYSTWKDELLSTSFGRELWNRLTTRTGFKLTVVVSNERKRGAGTDKLEFDRNGVLIGVTITLGSDLERGYPNSHYYPVIESLSAIESPGSSHGRLLAGTKLAHELGHVDQILNESADLLLLQDRLTPKYRSLFLKNGWNSRDERLVAMAEQMGGTPTSIWETREYVSEAVALKFLAERTGDAAFQCDLIKRVRRNVENNVGSYRSIFESVEIFTNRACR